MADVALEISAAAKQDHSHQISKQFAGSLFEQSTLLLFDALFQFIAQRSDKNAQTLWALHTNLE
jgi:6-phospho-3-hexuloisomerase